MPLFDFLTDDDGNILTTDVSDSIRSFIAAILAVLNDSAFDDEFILLILKRLETLGYKLTASDNNVWLIAFSINEVVSHIKISAISQQYLKNSIILSLKEWQVRFCITKSQQDSRTICLLIWKQR